MVLKTSCEFFHFNKYICPWTVFCIRVEDVQDPHRDWGWVQCRRLSHYTGCVRGVEGLGQNFCTNFISGRSSDTFLLVLKPNLSLFSYFWEGISTIISGNPFSPPTSWTRSDTLEVQYTWRTGPSPIHPYKKNTIEKFNIWIVDTWRDSRTIWSYFSNDVFLTFLVGICINLRPRFNKWLCLRSPDLLDPNGCLITPSKVLFYWRREIEGVLFSGTLTWVETETRKGVGRNILSLRTSPTQVCSCYLWLCVPNLLKGLHQILTNILYNSDTRKNSVLTWKRFYWLTIGKGWLGLFLYHLFNVKTSYEIFCLFVFRGCLDHETPVGSKDTPCGVRVTSRTMT